MRLALPNYLFGFGLYANFQSHGAHHDYFAHFSFKLSLTTAANPPKHSEKTNQTRKERNVMLQVINSENNTFL